jgi:hypothetical protein
MITGKHAELPWRWHTNNTPHAIDIDAGCERICSIDLDVSGVMFNKDDRHDTPDNEVARRKANAEFIVKAVNNYDALVDVLERLFEHCAMIHKHWGDNSNQKQADAAIADAKELLAKVKGNK